ncbi:MAG: hypothetical protein ACHREM_05960 [Polyangiales bacterium]
MSAAVRASGNASVGASASETSLGDDQTLPLGAAVGASAAVEGAVAAAAIDGAGFTVGLDDTTAASCVHAMNANDASQSVVLKAVRARMFGQEC